MKKTPLMRLIEHEQGRSIEAIITDLVESGLSWVKIAERLGVPYPTLNDWRRDLGIEVVKTVRIRQAVSP